MKTRRRRSSPKSPPLSGTAVAIFCAASSSRPISSRFRSSRASRRNRSMARCLAVPMSQAPGLSGTPDSGHCSRAATSASCARSSATPTSRTNRARPAISRADSIRQTASIVRLTSLAGTLDRRRHRLAVRLGLLPQARLLLAQLGSELLAEVLSLEDRTDLDDRLAAGHRVRDALDPLNRLVERLHLPHPVAREQLLGLG